MSTPSIEWARLLVPCGPLADALAPRFVRSLAAHTPLGIARVDEAVLLVEALSAGCGVLLADGELELSALVRPDGLELIAGPFAAGIPRRLLDEDFRAHGVAVVAQLASSSEVRAGRDGRERLHLVVT